MKLTIVSIQALFIFLREETLFVMDLMHDEVTMAARATARSFAEQHLLPNRMEWDEKQQLPLEVLRALGKLGLMGVLVPEQYGGSGLGYMEYAAIIEELASCCGGIGLSVAAHNSLCCGHILLSGNEHQKKKYLPRLADGTHLGAWALTEANTGSDAANMQTTAIREGDHWVLNGTKNWITHGISADVMVVMARTGPPRTKHNATAFILSKGTPGLRGGKKENKLGMRASETAEVILDQVRVPDEDRMGEVGDGFRQALKVLDGGRISIAALSLGIAKGAYAAALQYAQQRHQFGQAIAQFQAISFKLADMATEICAAEWLIHQACDRKNRLLPVTKEAAMAKYYASEVAVKVATDAVQIFGGYGYTKDFPAEKYYRDSKLCTIGEGTSEIQKLVIAREVLNA